MNDFGGQPSDFQGQIDEAERKRLLAQLLIKQGLMGDQPQGRMVSGHYVKSNPLQHLAKIASVVGGQYMDSQATKDIGKAKGEYADASSADLAKVQRMLQSSPEQQVPNFVMEAEMDGTVPEAVQPGRAADPVAAERAAQQSQFPGTQALGKAMYENRMKQLEKYREALTSRVGVGDVGKVFNATDTSPIPGLQPKQEIKFVDGVPVATPTEYTPGGTAPSRIGPGYAQTQTTGANGRPLAAQQHPITDEIKVIDKAPVNNVNVKTGGDEDPYFKKMMTDLGERDAKVVMIGRDAGPQLGAVGRLREIHQASGGNWTGGPIADPVKFVRDLASQVGVPIDAKVDMNNAKMQVEFSQKVAAAIIGQGRGLTNEDRQALEKSFPTNKITPANFPAFMDQYERMLRDNAKASDTLLQRVQSRGNKERMPTALRDNEPLPQTNRAEINAARARYGLPPL